MRKGRISRFSGRAVPWATQLYPLERVDPWFADGSNHGFRTVRSNPNLLRKVHYVFYGCFLAHSALNRAGRFHSKSYAVGAADFAILKVIRGGAGRRGGFKGLKFVWCFGWLFTRTYMVRGGSADAKYRTRGGAVIPPDPAPN